MQEAIHKIVTDFAEQLKSVTGDHVQRLSIIITGTAAIADLSQPMQSSVDGILNVSYQTETINTPIHTDVTIVMHQ